jgi:hypothetical protein
MTVTTDEARTAAVAICGGMHTLRKQTLSIAT